MASEIIHGVFPPDVKPLEVLLSIMCESVGVAFVGLQDSPHCKHPLVIFQTRFGAGGAMPLDNFGTDPLREHVRRIYDRFNKPYREVC